MWRSEAGLIAASARTVPPPVLHRPTSLPAALAALREHDHPPTLVAGATDLCAAFLEGLAPTALVALDRIPELRPITADPAELRIAAAVTHAEGAAHPLVRTHLPGLADAWARIANTRVRYRATIGGNLMARRTRYEMSALLLALDARLRCLTPDGAELTLTPADLWRDAVPPRALLREIAIPLRPRPRLRYDRSLRPTMTLATCVTEAATRTVIATEWLQPALLTVPAGDPAAAFTALPDSFADAASTNWYLRRAGTALLRRGLEALDA